MFLKEIWFVTYSICCIAWKTSMLFRRTFEAVYVHVEHERERSLGSRTYEDRENTAICCRLVVFRMVLFHMDVFSKFWCGPSRWKFLDPRGTNLEVCLLLDLVENWDVVEQTSRWQKVPNVLHWNTCYCDFWNRNEKEKIDFCKINIFWYEWDC